MNFDVIEHAPLVYLVGITQPTDEIFDYLGDRELEWTTTDDLDPTAVIEYGGRISYESWVNAKARPRATYIQDQLIGKHHGSCLEHLTYNLIVADVPRSVQMEQIRHRQGYGYSWTSQRYVDRSIRVVIPPRLRGNADAREMYLRSTETDIRVYERLVAMQLEGIAKPTTMDKKRAREAARAALPNGIASDGEITLNARAARHLIELRTDATADLSMREFAYNIYLKLAAATPAIFADAVLTPTEHVPEVKFVFKKV